MEVAKAMKGEACMKTHTSDVKWRFRDSWCPLGGGPLFVAVSGSHQMQRETRDLQEARYSSTLACQSSCLLGSHVSVRP